MGLAMTGVVGAFHPVKNSRQNGMKEEQDKEEETATERRPGDIRRTLLIQNKPSDDRTQFQGKDR